MSLPPTSFAMVLTEKRKLEPRDIKIPDTLDDTALLRIEVCGICGSDYEQFNDLLKAPMPVIPGHEPLGIIESIGDAAAKRWGVDVGDRVAVETMLPCHHCVDCHSGFYHLCHSRSIYSYISLNNSHGLWGAYSQYMVLDSRAIVHKVDASLAPEIAVMFNPLGAGFRWAVEIPKTGPGDNIVIMGPGQRGLASVVAAKMAGASQIIVTGTALDSKKLALAKTFGADHVIDVDNENTVERVREITGGRGADIALDVSSYATQPITDAIRFLRTGGTLVMAGMKGFKAVPEFVSDLVVMKEITIKGAIGVTSSGYLNAIKTLESGKFDFSAMHTHDFSLQDAERAIQILAREIDGEESIHSVLIPPS